MKTRNIIPNKLSVIERRWTNKDGTKRTRYRARIRQRELQKSVEITLKASDEADATQEAIELWAKHSKDVERGNDISARRKKFEVYSEKFIAQKQSEADAKQITQKRVVVIEHCMKPLARFWDEHRRPALDRLAEEYDKHYRTWRDQQVTRLTKKPLATATKNLELSTHRSFFLYCQRMGYCDRTLTSKTLKIPRTEANKPFPTKAYKKLLSVALKEINSTDNDRLRWNYQNYYHMILVMNGIGCRVTELLNMKWEHLTQSNESPWLFIEGKDKERQIVLPSYVANYLNRLKAWKARHGKAWDWSEESHPYIFNAYRKPTASRQIDGGTKNRWFEKAGVKNSKDYAFVCFRHKFVTDKLRLGNHPLHIAEYVGTSQLMIERTYKSLVPKETFERVFDGSNMDSYKKDRTPKFMLEDD